jgi:hypothetical protein
MIEVIDFEQPADHGPIPVTLCLLGLNEIGQREQGDLVAVDVQRGPARPEFREGRHTAQDGHEIHPNPVGASAPEAHGMAAIEEGLLEWRHGHLLAAQVGESGAESGQVGGVGNHGEVDVAAKLRRAVRDARLAAHEQALHVVPAHRRKDFAYRVRDQAILPDRDRRPTVWRSPPSAGPASSGTTPPTPPHRCPRSRQDPRPSHSSPNHPRPGGGGRRQRGSSRGPPGSWTAL